jgi:predicted permease
MFRRRRNVEEFVSEIESHLVNEADRLESEGLSREAAIAAARRAFGNVTAAQERFYETGRWIWVDHLLRDLRYALRMLGRSPGFTVIAVLTLAFGIGANSAIFSLVNAVLLRPLPFADPDRLVMVWEETSILNLHDSWAALGNAMDWKARNHVFQDAGIIDHWPRYKLSVDDRPELVQGAIITSGLTRTLGVQPILGRAFADEDDRPGAAKSLLLGHALWQQRFAGDPDIAGRKVMVDGQPYTVRGVMPAGFRFPDRDTAIWTPAGAAYTPAQMTSRGRHDFMFVARLKPGVTLAQANQDLKAIAEQLKREYPESNSRIGAFVAPLREHFVGTDAPKLFVVLLGMSAFILLIACANIANLLLSRAANRRREFAVRAALGAGRGNIVHQLLAENLLLAAAGGALGLVIALACFDWLAKFIPGSISGMTAMTLDGRVLGFTLLLATITSLLFGFAPALETVRLDLSRSLKQAAGRGAGGQRSGLRAVLATTGVALAIVLLIGAGLMIRTFLAVRGVDPGFRTEKLLTLSSLGAKREGFHEQALERIRALPGVVSAGFTTGAPLVFKGWIAGALPEGAQDPVQMRYRSVTPGYLQTLGVPLRAGRFLEDRDDANAPQVVVINEAMARRCWPNADALGKRLSLDPRAPWIQVVGIVGNMHQSGLDVAPNPEIYRPYKQEKTPVSALAVRSTLDPLSLVPAIRQIIRNIDKEQIVQDVQTMDQVLDREVIERRLHMLLLGAFAALALGLASLGIYGLLSYLVAYRTQEIGVRMALGASPKDILGTVVVRGMAMAAAGIAAGLLGALALARVMSHMLFGISPSDAPTYAAVAAGGLAVAAFASYIPARRAMRVDPVVALRDE